MHTARVDFLGCPVDGLSMNQSLDKLEEFIRDGSPHHVAVTNANKLWLMTRNPAMVDIMRQCSLVLPEKAIVIGSKLLGLGVDHHVGGIMLLKAFLPRAQEKGYRVYFLGAKPEVVERMIENLRQKYPRLRIAGWHHGYVPAADDEEISRSIRDATPDILFVAMGTPRQEFWIAQHLSKLSVPVCMGVGGSFDVLAEIKRDAPDWVRTLSMEWLYRLVQDPKNLWKRYLLTIPWFLKAVLCARLRQTADIHQYEQT